MIWQQNSKLAKQCIKVDYAISKIADSSLISCHLLWGIHVITGW
jgi:hypothetical protein